MPVEPVPPGSDQAGRVLAAVLATSEDAILIKDLSGTVLFWSHGAERIYGYTAAEIVGRPIATIIPADRMDEFEEHMRRLASGQRVGPEDTVRLTKNGRRIQAVLTITPIADDSGQVTTALAIARDVTGQRWTDRAMRAGDARWQAIIESAVDGIIVINRHGRIESFNPAAERLFGYRADEVIGQNVTVLMPQPYADEHDHYLKRYLDTREARIIGSGRDVTGRRKDGSTFPLHLSVGQASIDGESRFTGIVRDLTERVAMEVKLRHESGLARLGELAAVLAHEVKNPLAAVSGAVQMLGGLLPSGGEEQDVVREVLLRIDGLNNLMGDLLMYARPPQPVLLPISVLQIARSVSSFFKADPNWRHLRLDVDGFSGAVMADPQLIRIALQNLLINAGQAMRGQGVLVVRTQESDGMAHVDVVDSGPGMTFEVQERVFTPFFTTKSRGTGLGLPTVQRIAESHGGLVRILRTGAGGTTMRLSLPLVPASSSSWPSS